MIYRSDDRKMVGGYDVSHLDDWQVEIFKEFLQRRERDWLSQPDFVRKVLSSKTKTKKKKFIQKYLI